MNTLEELYHKAVENIKGEPGVITITLAGIPKISGSNDIVGNCVQEWIPQWLEDNGLNLKPNDSPGRFPDFTADINGVQYDMEVKCWNCQNAPAFDLANFDGFYREVYNHPDKLYATYLIFAYTPTKHGFVISDIYLKKLWEITSRARKYPLGLQIKQKRSYAIRPFAFHKKPGKSFADIHEFVEAVYKARKMFPLPDMIDPDDWQKKVSKAIDYRKLEEMFS